MRIPNDKLNKEIVLKHKKGESFGQLSKHYGRSKSTLHDIWKRNKDKYELKGKSAVRVI